MAAMTTTELSSRHIEVPTAGRYRINPEASTVTFTTRHLFGLAPVRGTFALRDGVISVADPLTESGVWARVSAPSFRTGNDTRDAAVLSPRLLNADAHPSFTFSSTALVEGPGHWLLRGELEVRGAARPAEVRIGALAVADDGATIRATARVTIDRYAFGITGYRGLAGRRLAVDLGIVAHRATASANA